MYTFEWCHSISTPSPQSPHTPKIFQTHLTRAARRRPLTMWGHRKASGGFRAKFVADKPQIAHLTTVVYTKLSPPSVNPPSGHKTEAFTDQPGCTDGTTPLNPFVPKKSRGRGKKKEEENWISQMKRPVWPGPT